MFLNSSFSYRKKRLKWNIHWLQQILNTKTINDDTFSQTGYRSSHLVQPRYVVFSLKYNL
jgi:hypothetical protein